MVRVMICLVLLSAMFSTASAQEAQTATIVVIYLGTTGISPDITVEVGDEAWIYPEAASDIFHEIPAGTTAVTFSLQHMFLSAPNPVTLNLEAGSIHLILLYHNGETITANRFELEPASEKESPWYFINMLATPITVAADETPVIDALQPGMIGEYNAPMYQFTETVTASDGTELFKNEGIYGEPYYLAITVLYPLDGTPQRYVMDFITTDVFKYLKATSVLEVGMDFWSYLELLEQTAMQPIFEGYSPQTTFIAPVDAAFEQLPADIRNNPDALRNYLTYLAYDQATVNINQPQAQVISMSGQMLNFETTEEAQTVQGIPLLFYLRGIYGDVILVGELPLPQ